MTVVTVREFAYNPSAMFARVELGERIEVTRHGKVIAIVSWPETHLSGYDALVAQGAIKPPPDGGARAGNWHDFVHVDIPDDIEPLAIVEELREERDVVAMLDGLEAGR
ncbi:MAG TPA: hypothetical protein VLJ59_12280 [Mycobacteriales bacterium]|nr:hypothetical protein [Mycobacteriales bacterium]